MKEKEISEIVHVPAKVPRVNNKYKKLGNTGLDDYREDDF